MARTTTAEKIASAEAQLAEVLREKDRQAQYLGVRFGVIRRLRELERDERRIWKRIDVLRQREKERSA